MVEARQKVDAFDAGIPKEGVFVHRVQTTDPAGDTWDVDATEPVVHSRRRQPHPRALAVGGVAGG